MSPSMYATAGSTIGCGPLEAAPGARLASGGYDVAHGTQVLGVVPGRRAPYVWTEGTDPSALAQDIKTILAKKVRSS